MSNQSTEYGQKLRRLRLERGFTQAELGKAAGFNNMTVSQIETGAVKMPRSYVWKRLMKVLGVEENLAQSKPAGFVSTGDAANQLQVEFGHEYHRETVMEEIKYAARNGHINADASSRKVKVDYASARAWYVKNMHHLKYERPTRAATSRRN